jgi:hypothetical protein
MNKVVELYPGRQKLIRNQLVTIADLQTFKTEFKEELLKEIKLIVVNQPSPPHKKWLKSSEVRSLLEISRGTLQTLRDNGTIPHCRIGNIFYYDPAEIDKEILKRKSQGRNRSNQFLC